MGKVVTKQGFLGIGRPLVTYYCDKCGAQCENRHCQGDHIFCRPCANLVNPEIVHNWSSDESVRDYKSDEFFLDTSDGKKRYIEQCSSCLGLLVVVLSGSYCQRLYYELGSSRTSTISLPCISHSGYNEHGDVRIQEACEHEFIVIGTSKRLDTEAHSKYKRMMSHRNRQVETMFGTDEIDMQYHCFGTTHFWCCKCGLHHSLNPQREYLLPKRGRIVT